MLVARFSGVASAVQRFMSLIPMTTGAARPVPGVLTYDPLLRRLACRAGLVLLALAMGGFAIGTTEFAAMSLLPYFANGLSIDEPTAGHVISAYALGVVVGAPVIAVLAARLPRYALLIGLMAVFALANGLSALAPSYETMLVFRFLSGLPHGAYFGVASLVAVSLVPPERRSQAVARVMLGLTIATIIGVPVANWIGQGVGWRWGFGLSPCWRRRLSSWYGFSPRATVVMPMPAPIVS